MTGTQWIRVGVAVAAHWALFFRILYAACPPREIINSPRYDKFLQIVDYYGGLNIRGIFMKSFYGAKPEDAPPIPSQVKPQTNGAK